MAVYDLEVVRRIQQSSGTPGFTSIGGIKTTAMAWTRDCGAPSSIEAQTTVDGLDPQVATALLDLSVAPCELWLRRDGVLVAAGPLVGYNIDGRQITLHGQGIAYYLGYMVQTANVTTAVDIGSYTATLIEGWQTQTYGHFGIDTSHVTALGVTMTFTGTGAQFRSLNQVIADMGNRDNGFDMEITPTDRRVILYAPRKGSDLSASVIIDRRSIGSPKYQQSAAAGSIASEAYGAASVAAGSALTSTKSNTTLRQTFGRTAITGSFQNVDTQSTLDDRTGRLLDTYDQVLVSVQPGLLAVPGFGYGDFDTGDQVTYSYDAGLGLQTSVQRVKTIVVDTSSGDERFALAFF